MPYNPLLIDKNELSVLIGGEAGYGIDTAGLILARLLSRLGWRVYIYRDYPSLIRGGHTFSIIRAAKKRLAAHSRQVDFLLALNQATVDLHRDKIKTGGQIIFEAKTNRNAWYIGAFGKTAGLEWALIENSVRQNLPKELELNLQAARQGYDAAKEIFHLEKIDQPPLPILTGNEALSLGLLAAGLQAYAAYPMTPSSTILHFMAEAAEKFSLKVLQPEGEIAVMLTALGFAYAGTKVAVGTSGGGFCLMTEGVSFAGMAELPVVVVVGQRTGPSTGLPTYTAQTELHFVLNAGQGEFPRFLAAPGDAEEAYSWAGAALNLAWRFRIPSFILTDKTLAEGGFNFNLNEIKEIREEYFSAAPLGKVNSYEHDERGLTTEDATLTKTNAEKRRQKGEELARELENFETVKVYGERNASTALLCWGSNKGVCAETAEKFGLKVIQPIVLSPFPVKQFSAALSGVKKLICVENNATGQLAKLLKLNGFGVDQLILKYDGRPFDLDELEGELKKWI